MSDLLVNAVKNCMWPICFICKKKVDKCDTYFDGKFNFHMRVECHGETDECSIDSDFAIKITKDIRAVAFQQKKLDSKKTSFKI